MNDEKDLTNITNEPDGLNNDMDDDLSQAGKENFEELFQESLRQPQVGEVVEGVVVQIDPDYVLVNIGYKSEGCIPLDEFMDENGELTVKVGDEVRVLFEKKENIRGYVVLSKKKAEREQVWEKIEEAVESGGYVEGKIVANVKGGLTVDIGVPAFLPASQVDVRPVGNLEKLIGETYQFKVVKVNKKRGNVVLSRRVILEEEREKLKKETLATLAEGQIVEGVVKNITDYGAFIDLGGIDGLLHIVDMSWRKLSHPSELIKIGDTVTVKVLKYDEDKEKISLGIKQTIPDPWLSVESKYHAGDRIVGTVVSLADYGAFVSLEEGVEGLVHVSEMSWTKRIRHPSDILKVGDEVAAEVLGVDVPSRRISLGMKQIQVNPWTVIGDKYPVGTKIEGQIKNVTDFGIFIGVEDGIDGLVHVSDMSWTKRIKHPSEIYGKGQTVQAVVLNIDPENERLSLGIKQLVPDPWTEIPDKYRPGTKVKGSVTSVTDFGIFLEIEEGIEGLIHVSELSQEKIATPKGFAAVGDELEAMVLNIDPVDKKIALSIKALSGDDDRGDFSSYSDYQGEATSNLGDLLKEEMTKKNGAD
ncbi:MAG TPA: 30S ribosomal protein S1 [Geobacteraceae bacterium]|nr:30S ribosomal protein S1 [Geobacteraceae bacterium]